MKLNVPKYRLADQYNFSLKIIVLNFPQVILNYKLIVEET